MRDLYILADKNMYINKNHVKREEALAEKKLDRRLLKSMKKYGSNFSDCLYCDAKQDTYRVIRASEAFFPCGGRQLFRRGGADCRRTRGAGRPQGGAQQITAAGAVRGAFRKEPRSGICSDKIFGANSADYGRLTAIFVDADPTARCNAIFLLAFETIDSVQPRRTPLQI